LVRSEWIERPEFFYFVHVRFLLSNSFAAPRHEKRKNEKRIRPTWTPPVTIRFDLVAALSNRGIAMSAELLHGQTGRTRVLRLVPALGCIAIFAVAAFFSADVSGRDQGIADAVTKANAFLSTLDAKQKEKVLLDFDSGKKPSWSNLPVTMVPRNGLPLGELTKPQRAAALATLAAVLSKPGYQKAIDIMNADDQLVKDKGNKMRFGTENYYLAIFGTPSETTPWMLQFGGHHLGINVTVVGKDSVVTPTHTGAQPDSFARDGQTVRPLGVENDLGFKLVSMLDREQKKQAVLSGRPINLQAPPGKDRNTVKPEGLKCASLKDDQRAVLMELIGAWVHLLPDAAAASRLAALKSKIDETWFAWYGPTENGSAAYFRIQGPSLLIEYAPQGGTGHIHTIIRDPSNEYGKGLIKS
jgi:hypothetical protein